MSPENGKKVGEIVQLKKTKKNRICIVVIIQCLLAFTACEAKDEMTIMLVAARGRADAAEKNFIRMFIKKNKIIIQL